MLLKKKVNFKKKQETHSNLTLFLTILRDFKNGLNLIQHHYLSGHEKSDVLENIINVSIASDMYCDCFQYSFEEEVSELSSVIEFYNDRLQIQVDPYTANFYPDELHPFDSTFLGFHLTRNALEELEIICKQNTIIDYELKNIHNFYNYDYRLFQDGVSILKERFFSFEKYYFEELKEAIGQNEFDHYFGRVNKHLLNLAS